MKTVEYYPDFFNDVFGPVMQPGSSSHTAGPCRMGYWANMLLKAPLKDILIELDKNGSFAGTFGLMNEDLGMLAGAYGLLPNDTRLFDIKKILTQEGIGYRFQYMDFPANAHPNAVNFILTDTNGRSVTLSGNSVGGGMIETVKIMGIPYRFIGDSFLTCVAANSAAISELCQNTAGILGIETISDPSGKELFLLRSEHSLAGSVENIGVVLFQLAPILPAPTSSKRKKQLFASFPEWIAFAKAEQISLAEAAVIYEQNATGWSAEHITNDMKMVRTLMEQQTQAVYEEDRDLLQTPYSGYHYVAWRDYESNKTPLAGAVIAKAIHYAFGTQAQIKGVPLVPGPMGTGGGFLFSAMRAVKETYQYSEESLLDGLFVAAGVGVIAYTRTNPTGEILGCAGECGICGAMAAAGITQMAGGTPEQVEAAASLTLQAALGWPCDPIPGGQNQPCVSRFLTAVVMSIIFSDLALSGRNPVIPFHEVVDAADKLGRQMSDSLKCTSAGGLCDTPTGKQCKHCFEIWHRAQK